MCDGYVHVCEVPWRPEEGSGFLGTRVRSGWDMPDIGVWN